MKTDIKRAALYIRVSTDEQAMHGLSLDAQKQALYDYAQKHGYKVVDLYADEGITARKKYRNRTGFMRMLQDVEAKAFDVILFIKLDRWFRNIADYYEVQRTLDANNVQWIATEERYDTTTANGRLNLNIRLSIAQDESDRTSERIKFVFKDKVRRGESICGMVPIGYKIEDKRLVIDPERAEIARGVFDYYVAMRSMRAVQGRLLDKHGIVLSHYGVRHMLENKKYIGHYGGNDDFCEPLISAEQFALVQRLLTERGQRNVTNTSKHVYLFTSIAFCAECGGRLRARTVRQKYAYYRCGRYDKAKRCPHKTQTSELILEQWLLDNLCLKAEEHNIEAAKGRHKTKQVDAAKIREKIQKLTDIYMSDLIERSDYESRYNALKQQLEAQVEPEPKSLIDIAALKNILETYHKLDKKHKKMMWSKLIEKITIDQSGNIGITYASSIPYRI